MTLTRRMCLFGGAGALGAASLRPISKAISVPLGVTAIPQSEGVGSASTPSQDLLVVIFLRGGCDGLNLVAPVDDPNYVAARPAHLRVGDRGSNAGLPLANAPADFDFRLHAAASELKDFYDDGDLAIVHACGLTNGTRSHFEAQTLMELGTADDRGLSTGWLTRALAQTLSAGRSPLDSSGLIPAVAISSNVPTSLLRTSSAAAIADLEEFVTSGEAEYFTVLNQLYQGTTPVHHAGTRALDSLQTIRSSVAQHELILDDLGGIESYSEDHGYDFGRGLRTIATLARLDVGLRVATIDYGDWDTHADQSWHFEELVTGLSKSLSAFYKDMTRRGDRLTVLVMTEFGRRLRANESGGTDHGFGSVMLALGDGVNGGQIYGQWPGLATEQLDRGADLAITTDFRSVLGEYFAQSWQIPEIADVFPGLVSNQFLGLFNP